MSDRSVTDWVTTARRLIANVLLYTGVARTRGSVRIFRWVNNALRAEARAPRRSGEACAAGFHKVRNRGRLREHIKLNMIKLNCPMFSPSLPLSFFFQNSLTAWYKLSLLQSFFTISFSTFSHSQFYHSFFPIFPISLFYRSPFPIAQKIAHFSHP